MSMSLGFKIDADLAEIRNGLTQVRKDFKDLIDDVKAMRVDLKIDRPKLQAEIASAKALIRSEMGSGATQTIKVKIKADVATIQADLATIRPQIQAAIGAIGGQVRLRVDRPKLQADLAHAKALIRSELGSGATQTVKIKIKADATTIAADLAAMRPQIAAAIRTMGGVSVSVDLSTDPAQLRAQIATIRAQIRALLGSHGIASSVRLDVDLPHLRTQLRMAVVLVRNAIAQMSRLAGRINLNVNITSSLGNLTTSLDQLKVEIIRLRQAIASGRGGGGGGGSGGGGGGGGGLGSLVSTLAGGLGAGLLARQLVDVQTEFDRLNAGLITATGSAKEAAKAFTVLQEFARNTPYSLAQAVEGFTKLRNMGLTPSERALKSYGNTASAMGKDLMQFIEAVADAATLEFERLKEFGIRASQQGDNVSFTFQGVTTTVKKSAAEIENYLMQIGEVNFDGAMNERMKTLDGAIANFKQSWRDMLLAVSQSGLGAMLESMFRSASSALDGLKGEKLAEILAYLAAIGASTGLTLLGVAIGKVIFAIQAKIAALITDRNATIAATQTNLAAARVALVQANNELRVAEAQKLAATTATQLAAAEMALIRARAGLTVATRAYTAAQDAATAAASRAAVASRGLLAVMGGPVGLILTIGLLAAGFLSMRDNATSANTELEKIGTTAEDVTKKLNAMTEAQRSAHKAQIDQQITQENTKIDKNRKLVADQLRAEARKAGDSTLGSGFTPQQASDPAQRSKGQRLRVLAADFESGRLSASGLLQEINKIDASLSNVEIKTGGFAGLGETVSGTLVEVIGKVDDLTDKLKDMEQYEGTVDAAANKPLGEASTNDRLEQYKVEGDGGSAGGDVEKKASSGIMPNATLLQRKRELEQALNMIEADFSALQNKTEADIEVFYRRKMELVKRLHDNEKALLQYQMSQTKDPVQRANIVEQGKDIDSKKGQLLVQIDTQKVAEVAAHQERMRQYQLEFDERAKRVYDLQRTEEQRVRAQYDLERRKIEEQSSWTAEKRENELKLLEQLEANAIADATKQMLDDEASRLEKVIVDRIDEYRAIEQQIRTKITQNPVQAQQLSVELEQVRQSFFNGEQGVHRFYLMLETLAQQGVPAAIEALKQLRGDVEDVGLAVPTAWQEAITNMQNTAANAGVDSLSGFFNDLVSGAKSFKDSLKDMAKSFISAMAQMAVKALATLAIFQLLRAMGVPVDLVGGGLSVGAKKHHSGGIAGGAGASKQYDISMFNQAPRYHVGGIAGMKPGEVPAILQAGEEVLTRNDPRHAANGGGGNERINVMYVDHPDRLADALSRSDKGRTVVMNLIEQNAGAIRQLLR